MEEAEALELRRYERQKFIESRLYAIFEKEEKEFDKDGAWGRRNFLFDLILVFVLYLKKRLITRKSYKTKVSKFFSRSILYPTERFANSEAEKYVLIFDILQKIMPAIIQSDRASLLREEVFEPRKITGGDKLG